MRRRLQARAGVRREETRERVAAAATQFFEAGSMCSVCEWACTRASRFSGPEPSAGLARAGLRRQARTPSAARRPRDRQARDILALSKLGKVSRRSRQQSLRGLLDAAVPRTLLAYSPPGLARVLQRQLRRRLKDRTTPKNNPGQALMLGLVFEAFTDLARFPRCAALVRSAPFMRVAQSEVKWQRGLGRAESHARL